MTSKTIYVDCPCCQTRIEVSAETGKVVNSWAKQEKKEGVDPFAEAIKKRKEEKEKLEKYFASSAAARKEKKKELEKHFEKEKQRIKDEKDFDKPLNPLDLD